MQKISNGAQRNLRRCLHGISKRARRDGREAHAVTVLEIGLFHGVAITALKDLRLVDFAALPDRANGMNYIAGLELTAMRCYSLASRQGAALFTDLFAFGQK